MPMPTLARVVLFCTLSAASGLRDGQTLQATALTRQSAGKTSPQLTQLARLRGGEKHSLSLKGASKMVKTCAFFASLDALLLGYDIGVVSGILIFVQERFKLTLLETGNFAAALNAAAIVGALCSGWIADRYGRKPSLFISSLMFTTGSFMMAAANSYKSLVIGRYVQGYGVGAGLLISPMFISEIAPPAFRGSLVTLSEVSLSFGVLLAYIVNVALAGLPGQWRWMLALGAVPGVLLTLRILFLPESPRYLVGKGKREEARAVLRLVMDNEPPAVADATLADIERRANEEDGTSWRLLLHRGTLFAVLVGVVLAALQHAVGIESIIYHSPMLFEKARGQQRTQLIALAPPASHSLPCYELQTAVRAVSEWLVTWTPASATLAGGRRHEAARNDGHRGHGHHQASLRDVRPPSPHSSTPVPPSGV